MDLLNQVTELRVDADALLKHAKNNINSAETTLAFRQLQMAKSWLGKFKGELGSKTPYKVASTKEEIPATADVSNVSEDWNYEMSHLDFVNKMRQDIFAMIDAMEKLPQTQSVKYSIKYFSEARFWYGFELANIRETA